MGNTALVTGASSGIGKELARYHASLGGDVVLVARSVQSLDALKLELESTYNIKVMVIIADLAQADSARFIYDSTQSANISVDILINNAGFGCHGKFHESHLGQENDMMNVNMTALVNLTHYYLQDMVKRNSGKILHIASVAGCSPGPLMATYSATKSFVISFSQGISQELSDTKVTSTVLCPGAVNTNFMETSGLHSTLILKSAVTANSVATCGYKAMLKGKRIVFNKLAYYWLFNWVLPLVPRGIALKVARKLFEQ